ncbi:rhodopsin-like gpcr transmembrane domain protein [Cystoisospora suis]|uniref:Rhodopsin-like gpcr transmembrane domain protein n=1 Tax=Cystoisospora suis TaxID=483139 RepID=A0A2C6LI74_9APIC|nr:rhodopsin-like gpcr transmembrane domain protein [Cystoisospora suis]
MRGLVFVLIASIVTRHAPGGSTSSSGSSGGHSDSRISSSSYQHPQHAFAVKVSGIFLVCQLVYILAESQAYTSVSAYARLRSCWGAILLLGNLCAAIFIFLVTANSSSLGSLDIVSTRTFYVNFATGCILYYLTPVLLVVFFTGSVLMDTIVLLLTEFVAVNILYRVLSRPVGGGGAGSLTALPSSSSFSGGSKPFPIISLQEAYHPYTDL